jgi:hypothetical protein
VPTVLTSPGPLIAFRGLLYLYLVGDLEMVKKFIAKFQLSKFYSFFNLLLVEIKKLFLRELSAS